MLKVYRVTYFVSIDGNTYERCYDGCGYVMKEDMKDNLEEIILDEVSFNEFYLYCEKNNFLWTDKTLFTNKPIIWLSRCGKPYKKFKSITLKRVYEAKDNVSLDFIVKEFPADKTIQYLKERGMSACPINLV